MRWITPRIISSFCHLTRILTNAVWLALPLVPLSATADLISFHPNLPTLSKRTSYPNCWARFSLKANESLCISRDLWTKYDSGEGQWLGIWKAGSPVELDQSRPKLLNYRFQAKALVEPPNSFLPLKKLERLRDRLSDDLEPHDPDGIFRSLLLGAAPRESGVFHLLGLTQAFQSSGIHLLILGVWIHALAFFLLGLFSLSSSTALRFRSFLTAAGCLWCWLLMGAPFRVVRTISLLALRSISRRSGMRVHPAVVIFTAVFLDLSLSLFFTKGSISETLSNSGRIYFIVLALSLALQSEKRTWTAIGFRVWLISALLSMIQGSLCSLAGFFLNTGAILWFAGVVYPALILKSVGVFDPSALLEFSESGFRWVIKFAVESNLLWIVSPTAVWIALLLSSILLIAPRERRTILGSAVGILALFAIFSGVNLSRASSPGFADQVEQLDVGQGDSAFVSENDTIHGLIDTGSARIVSVEHWLRFFARRGIRRLNWIGLTHLDEDHAGGVLPISAVVPINCVTTSSAELASPRGQKLRLILEDRGIHVTSRLEDCVPYPSLAPEPTQPSRRKSANENMSAFLIPLRNGGFYLSAGDATAGTEPRIGRWAIEQAKSFQAEPRILKISHHGSKTSSNPEFLQMIHPSEAWISDGVGNHYGHPSPEVLARLAKLKIPHRRTDEEGALSIRAEDVHRRR